MTGWQDIEHLVHGRLDRALSPEQERALDLILEREPELARQAEDLGRAVDGLSALAADRAPPDFARGVMERLELGAAGRADPRARTWGILSSAPGLLAAAAVVVAAVMLARDPSHSPDRATASNPSKSQADAQERGLPGGAKKRDLGLDDSDTDDREAALDQPAPPASAQSDEATVGSIAKRQTLEFSRDELVNALTAALESGLDGGPRRMDAPQADVARETDRTSKDNGNLGGRQDDEARARTLPDVIVIRRAQASAVSAGLAARTLDQNLNGLPPAPPRVLDALLGPAQASAAKSKARTQPGGAARGGSANPKLDALLEEHADSARRVVLDAQALSALAAKAAAAGYELYALDAALLAPTRESKRLGETRGRAERPATIAGDTPERAWKKLDLADYAESLDHVESDGDDRAKTAPSAPAPRSVIIVIAAK